MSLQQWWIQKLKTSVVIPDLLLLCMELRHFQEHHLILPSSCCLSSSHPLAFCVFYPPEQTRSRSRCTTVSSGACTQSRRFQQGVFAVLSFLRQDNGVVASCTNAMALLELLGEKRELEEGSFFSVPFFPLHHVTKWSVTLQCQFPAYNLDADF